MKMQALELNLTVTEAIRLLTGPKWKRFSKSQSSMAPHVEVLPVLEETRLEIDGDDGEDTKASTDTEHELKNSRGVDEEEEKDS